MIKVAFKEINKMVGKRPAVLMGLMPDHLMYPCILVSATTLLPCIYLLQAPLHITLVVWISSMGAWYMVAGKYKKYVVFMQMFSRIPLGFHSGHIRYKPMFSKRKIKRGNRYLRDLR